MAMSDYTLGDIAAATGNNDGFGGNGSGWWIILLFILLGGWGGGYGRGYGNMQGGAGGAGGDMLYPWLNQAQTQWQGISDIQQQLCGCCGDMQQAVSQGFANAETAANARQMANMQQQFALQSAMMQGFNGVQSQACQFNGQNQLALANQTATILSEHCADRNALQMGVRDIIDSNTRGNQMIMDKLCQLELDGVKNQLAQSERENNRLNNQLTVAEVRAGQMNAVDSLYNRLQNCPVPSEPVYGRQPIFTCQQNSGCGCGCAA